MVNARSPLHYYGSQQLYQDSTNVNWQIYSVNLEKFETRPDRVAAPEIVNGLSRSAPPTKLSR